MRWFVAAMTLILATSCAIAEGDESPLPSVPITRDLAADAARAARSGLPLLLIFSQDHCEYCEKLDREALNPAQATGAYRDKIMMRRFMMDSASLVRDFDGTQQEADALAHRLKIYVTPTLLFVDGQGIELAPRIVGIESLDFFGAYLEQSIDHARAKMGAH